MQDSGDGAAHITAASLPALFADLRRLAALTPPQLAASLATSPAVVIALERGDWAALPPWAETERVVTRYLTAARIDPRAVLSVLAHELSAASRERPGRSRRRPAPAKKARAASAAIPPLAKSLLSAGRGIGLRLRVPPRRVLVVALPVMLLFAAAQTSAFDAAEAAAPGPVTRLVSGIGERVRVMVAPKRDGFAWIEVADPRQRRGDKLHNPGR